VDSALSYDEREDIRRSFLEAARNGDIDILSAHLAQDVDVNMPGWEGETAVIEAAFHNRPAALKFLARAGANLDLHENQGSTALICAINNNAIGCIKVLIDNFADLQEPNYAGVTPVNIALSANRAAIAQLLEEAVATEANRKALATYALQEPVAISKRLTLKRGRS
jgi:ankyrin repeat protein